MVPGTESICADKMARLGRATDWLWSNIETADLLILSPSKDEERRAARRGPAHANFARIAFNSRRRAALTFG